ncbi:MAG: hypothetical protein R6X34_24245 [Chloroflexota bacterium]
MTVNNRNKIPLIDRFFNWLKNFSGAVISLSLSVTITVVLSFVLHRQYTFVETSPYLRLFVISMISTSILAIWMLTGLWDVLPRRNPFHQPNFAVPGLEKSLQRRTQTTVMIVILIAVSGLILLWTNIISTDPTGIGRGGLVPNELPQETIERLQEAILATIHHSTLPLNMQTRDDLLLLFAELENYQGRYGAATVYDWEKVNDLVAHIDQVQKRLPNITSTLQPELGLAKGDLIRFVSMNEPFSPDTPSKALDPFMWVWFFAVSAIGAVSIVLTNQSARTYLEATHANFRPASEEEMKTAVTKQLRNHPQYPCQNHLHFKPCRPRPDNKGYYCTVLCFNRSHTQPRQENDRPVRGFIFAINNTGQIEDPLFITNICYVQESGSQQTRYAIEPLSRSSLIRNLDRKLNREELDQLFHELSFLSSLPTTATHQQKITALIDQIERQGRICTLIEWLQTIRPRENWLAP